MALTTAEISRIKAELGFNLMTSSAVPWIDVAIVFEQIVQPYLQSGVSTTSATAVTAATTPTPVTLTLASATGFATGDKVWVDVDSRQELATIQNLSGAAATMLLSLAHSGTYPIVLDQGEAIVREILDKIRATKARLVATYGGGGLKKVDEIEFYQAGSKTLFGHIGDELMFWRDELGSVLGVPNMWSRKRAAGGVMSVY